MSIKSKISLFFILFILNVNVAYADSDIDLMDFPERLGEALGIGTFAGGILCSIIFTSMWCLPLVFASNKAMIIIFFIIGLMCICFCTAVSWLPVWVLVIITFSTALLYGKSLKDLVD